MNQIIKPTRLGLVLLFSLWGIAAQAQSNNHALAMHGDPTLPSTYSHFTDADPRALKGGTLRMAQPGSFDSLNPFAVRGNVARNIRERVFESLMARHYGEAFSLYGLLAESVETDAARQYVRFRLRAAAQFSDGQPVRADDVIFSWNLLKEQGKPNHRYYYSKVKRVEKNSPREVTFHFDKDLADRELPLIIGLMPILPQHIYEARDIKSANLQTPIGSGPYMIEEVTPGAQVVFTRNADYWGNALPTSTGRHNFDRLVDNYFRDEGTAFESFKAGDIDVWVENNPQRWLSGFDFPAARDGRITKLTVPLGTPSGLRGFVLNTRRPLLADRSLRQALDLMFDFQWVNRVLFGGTYKRTESYFGNTALSATGNEADPVEMQLLADSLIEPEILIAGYKAPVSDGSGRDRMLRLQAMTMLEEAGYTQQAGKLFSPNGTQVKFEILVQQRADQRLAMAWRRMLAQIGIELNVRLLDSSQYQRHLQSFDYDIIIYNYYASLSPGNEQAYYWGSAAADTPGSRNYAGIRDKGVDAAINALTSAETPAAFTIAARALDRAIMNGHYFVPLYHLPNQWLAHWHYIGHPFDHSLYGARLDSWWISHDN